MTERTFIRLHEYNDNEGERWNWWLQLTGNEDELSKFAELLRESADPDDPWHELFPQDVECEYVVDKLVQYGEHGYHASQTKVTGTFACPDYLGVDAELLYKGGICTYFTGGDT